MSEKVFYDDGKNKVTDKRFVVGNETYAIANITSVKVTSNSYQDRYENQQITRPKTEQEIAIEKKRFRENKGILLFFGLPFLFFLYGLIFISFWSILGILMVIAAYFNATKPSQNITETRTILVSEAYTSYVLVINTAGGETPALSSRDNEVIQKVAEALNNAIISRG